MLRMSGKAACAIADNHSAAVGAYILIADAGILRNTGLFCGLCAVDAKTQLPIYLLGIPFPVSCVLHAVRCSVKQFVIQRFLQAAERNLIRKQADGDTDAVTAVGISPTDTPTAAGAAVGNNFPNLSKWDSHCSENLYAGACLCG